MKIQRLFYTIAIILASIISFSQVKVNPEGELFILGGHNINFQNSENYQDPGDVVFLNGNGTEMSRIWTSITYFRIRGNHGGNGGIRMDVNTENVSIKSNPSITYEFYVTGDAYATSGWYGSDYRFKENIKYIDDEYASKLLNLQGASYNIKTAKENVLENDTSLIAKGDTSKIILNPDFYTRTRLGFIAQEVQAFYPELVKEDEDGFLAVNYDGFIPILLELIKDQQKKINEIKALLSENVEKLKKATLDTKEGADVEKSAKLYQNQPNPFTTETTIRFEIPATVGNAQLYICNMNGTLLRTVNINQRGTGSIKINGNELNAGMYLYSLVCDGKIVDTKQMLLTE